IADPERMKILVPRLKGCEKKDDNGQITTATVGVYKHESLPGLELRLGGYKTGGKTVKQVQSVVPPSPGTDGRPRVWNDVKTIAQAPESFYRVLEQIADSLLEQRRQSYGEKSLRADTAKIATTPEGDRHNTLRDRALALAGQVKAGTIPEYRF